MFNKLFTSIKNKTKSVKLWYDSLVEGLFKTKNIDHIMEETPKNKNQHQKGLPCPNCNSVTPVSLEMLIHNKPVFCMGCGTKFTLDLNESKDVIKDLKAVYDAQQKVKNMKNVKTSD